MRVGVGWGATYSDSNSARGQTENLFIAKFGSTDDKKKVLEGSPWMVGKHSVISERRGSREAGLIGEVIRMDGNSDGDGEVRKPFLRARVTMLKPEVSSNFGMGQC